MNSNPLGKYAEIVTAAISLFVVFAAVVLHGIEGVMGIDFDTAFVDNIALIAAGVLFGSRAVVNGAKEAVKEPIGELARDVAAVHKRLDEQGASPARDGDSQGEGNY